MRIFKKNRGLKRRARERRKKIICNRAQNFKDAEDWDLEFWQNLTPQERLSALVSILRDVDLVRKSGK